MNDSQTSSGAEFSPAGGSGQPIQVLPQKGVHCSAGMHDSICKNHSTMTHTVACFDAVLQVFQNLHKILIRIRFARICKRNFIRINSASWLAPFPAELGLLSQWAE